MAQAAAAGRSFVYEPVIVGSLEDAFCAAILNPNIAAVVINEGFALRSRHDAPVLRTLTASAGSMMSPTHPRFGSPISSSGCVPSLTSI